MALLGSMLIGSCENDRDDNPVIQQPAIFVLNSLVDAPGYYDLKSIESLDVSCERPDYGFHAVTTYAVEVALNDQFSQLYTLPTRYTSREMALDASEMAIMVCSLLVDEHNYDENTYPQDEIMTVYLRLKANLSAGEIKETYSNAIPVKVKSYFALEPLVMPEAMHLTGNGISNWEWKTSAQMIPVHGQSGKFWSMQYLGLTPEGENAEFKFNTIQDDDTAMGIDAEIDAASVTLADINGAYQGSIRVNNPGWYIIAISTEIDGRKFIYHVQLLKPEIYLHGGVTNNANWAAPDKTYMFSIPDEADGEFVSPPFDNDSQLRMCVMLTNGDWEWYKSEFSILQGKIAYRGNGGEQEAVNVKQGQKAYLTFSDGTGRIE